MKQKDMFGSKQ